MLSNKTTRYTLVLDNPRVYVELPRKLENIKYIRISNLKYKAISLSQELLIMQMSNQSGVQFNHNLYFSGTHFINVTKCFYLGPKDSVTLYEAQSNEAWTIMLDRVEAMASLDISFLIDGELTNDISQSNKIVMTIDFIAE